MVFIEQLKTLRDNDRIGPLRDRGRGKSERLSPLRAG
jgi:hypothetical protein